MSHQLFAHAFGQNYTLPLPLWLYLFGGAAAVILSFLVVGFVVNDSKGKLSVQGGRLLGTPPGSLTEFLRLTVVAILIMLVVSGLVGSQNPLQNFNVTFFWIIFLLGSTYACALFGDLWKVFNPYRTITEWAERALDIRIEARRRYPAQLGYYPALLIYVGIIWLELISAGYGVIPAQLSQLILFYSLFTIIGIVIYGKNSWLARGEFFGVFFGLVGRMAPITYKKGKFYLRPPFVGLLGKTEESFSLLLFVLFMVASTAFDGLRETSFFYPFYRRFDYLPYELTTTVLLLLTLAFFVIVYWLLLGLMHRFVRTRRPIRQLGYRFTLTLVPIAVAYNAAHYYTLILTEGQHMIRLISDPFGWGWNLLGTSDYSINLQVLNVSVNWYSQVALIVAGHMAAVYLAHRVAMRVYPTVRAAVLSQYPMLLLMVIYTMTSLWIIAQPLGTA